MIKIIILLLLSSSCSWLSFDYWKVRSVIKEYQKDVQSFEFSSAQKYLTNSSQTFDQQNFNKKYKKEDLKNYKTLAKASSYSIKKISFIPEGAIVIVDESVPDYELMFGYIVSWHIQQSDKQKQIAPLDLVIENFINRTLDQNDKFYLIKQEITYLLVQENGQWKIKLD